MSEDDKKKNKPESRAKPMPEPIPDTPENVAKAIMKRPPKKVWNYLKKARKQSK